jgi:DNA integrity scanning protein DisA with diadenylate cyclase activity
MTQTFDFLLAVPVRVTVQDEEFDDAARECRERIVNAMRCDLPHAGITVRRVIRERAEECVANALKRGATQYEGALIVVESREVGS